MAQGRLERGSTISRYLEVGTYELASFALHPRPFKMEQSWGVARPFASLLAGVKIIWFSLSTPLSIAFLFKVPVSLKHRCRPGEAAFARMLGLRRGDLGVDGTPTASMRRGGLLGSSTSVVFPHFRMVEGRGRDLGVVKCCRSEGASTYIK